MGRSSEKKAAQGCLFRVKYIVFVYPNPEQWKISDHSEWIYCFWYFYFIVGSTRGMICFTRLKYDAQGERTEEDDNEAL